MLSFAELNKAWAKALREHAVKPLQGDDGAYRAIGDKHLAFLDGLWKARKAPLPDLGTMIVAGKEVRFWSDPHFFHANILHMTQRVEFRDVDEMNQAIWTNVKHAVHASDFVVCLGDLAMRNPLSVQRRLLDAYGDKQMTVVGNHDAKNGKPEAWAISGGASSLAFSLSRDLIKAWCEVDCGELSGLVDWNALPGHINFGCSHWPIPANRLPGPSWINLCGHIHRRPAKKLQVNFSVEVIDYRPKTLREMLTPELMDDLVRRQRGLDGFDDTASDEADIE